MRKHYMTLFTRGAQGIEITHVNKNDGIEVTCEQAINGGFHTLVTDINGNIINNDGFSSSDTDYLLRFIAKSRDGIIEEAKG